MALVIVCACGPRVLADEDETANGELESGDDLAEDCSARDGVTQARVVVGEGGIATIEVLTTGFDAEPEPLACGDDLGGCDYELHRLFPLEGLTVGGVSVAADDMLHEVEYCSCCNGEGGGPDESHGSYHYTDGAMTIDAVGDACVTGSFALPSRAAIAFVAERCDR